VFTKQNIDPHASIEGDAKYATVVRMIAIVA
jgi:hypothetical protein